VLVGQLLLQGMHEEMDWSMFEHYEWSNFTNDGLKLNQQFSNQRLHKYGNKHVQMFDLCRNVPSNIVCLSYLLLFFQLSHPSSISHSDHLYRSTVLWWLNNKSAKVR
jgi:hypothetical protein